MASSSHGRRVPPFAAVAGLWNGLVLQLQFPSVVTRRWCTGLGIRHRLNSALVNRFAIVSEHEFRLKVLSVQHLGQPVPVVVPHALDGQVVDGIPAWCDLIGLLGMSADVVANEYGYQHVPGRPRGESESYGRYLAQVGRCHAETGFLGDLSHGGLEWALTGFDMPAEPDDLPDAEAGLLPPEQHFPLAGGGGTGQVAQAHGCQGHIASLQKADHHWKPSVTP